MSDQQIEKFRLKRMTGTIDYNTVYQRRNGMVYTLEKNLIANSFIIGSKKMELPILLQATQRVTGLQTENVQVLSTDQITTRVPRTLVEIY